MKNLKVKYFMTPDPIFIGHDATIQDAARVMQKINCGFLPVGKPEFIEGVITDRDLVVKAIAKGKKPAEEKISEYVTKFIYACNEEDLLEDAAEKMREHHVSRLIVKNRKGKITGILSFGSILREHAFANDISNAVKHAVVHSAM